MAIGRVLVKHDSKPGINVIIIRVGQLRIGKNSGLGRVFTPIFEKEDLIKVDTHVESLTILLVEDWLEMN